MHEVQHAMNHTYVD